MTPKQMVAILTEQMDEADKENTRNRATIARQSSKIAAKDKALERLGSMEAFTYAAPIDKERDCELLARIDYARAACREALGEPT